MYDQLGHYIKRNVTISPEDLKTILSYFKPLQKSKNDFLLAQGQTSQNIYFLAKGCLRIFVINDEGKDSTKYIAFENHMATALVSHITKLPSKEYIQVIEQASLLYINNDDFNHLMTLIPAWSTFYAKYLEKAYVNTNNRLLSFTDMNALERYQQLLKINPEIVKRLPNKVVASYINISQETLSRLKSKI